MGDLAVFYFNTGRVAEATSLARQAVDLLLLQSFQQKIGGVETDELLLAGQAGLAQGIHHRLLRGFRFAPGNDLRHAAGQEARLLRLVGHGAGQAPLFFMNDTNCVLDDDLKPVEPGSGSRSCAT